MSYSTAFSQATEIILYISMKSEEENFKYLSIQSISEKLNMPIPSVKRLVGLLKNENLISSKTGLSGGLMLMKKTQDITLFDIFKAIEGNKSMFQFYKEFDVSKFEHSKQVEMQLSHMNNIFNEAEQAMLEVLKKKTILEIMTSTF